MVEHGGQWRARYSRRSDAKRVEKFTKKKMRGDPPPGFPGVQFNSLPTDRRALLSERLEQAIKFQNRKGFQPNQRICTLSYPLIPPTPHLSTIPT